ncbi:Sulfur carrier protein adenylyltransferase ThiF [Candidatus Ornithobacterium hominis]|uniref:ThiF family adenylyltransferase n=1 Tax=Candidatus Ornithobacterium hominis TaxID=2497989 RepID=UPI0024BCA664|nr:ThiF family adenylyltransferase [Candidatus Ornithobacterium hominis]CAI9429641.1 Sulfur carrier protein adenylyltransferase ThiF [Candidatus Ornithobacterium hominis]
MDLRYSRNRIYINSEEQKLIKNIPILIAGSGIGSVIAECALRLGFEHINIVDGDSVELSNLNRQNYLMDDIGSNKAEAIKRRLLSINPDAEIKSHNLFIDMDNIESIIGNNKIAVNAIDITSEVPQFFDKICQEKNIPILHPYNLGWGGLVAIISPKGFMLDIINKNDKPLNELKVVEYSTSYMRFWNSPQVWIEEIIEKYKEEDNTLPPPQLSVASWLVASMCTDLIFRIATNREVKVFPRFYLSTIKNE